MDKIPTPIPHLVMGPPDIRTLPKSWLVSDLIWLNASLQVPYGDNLFGGMWSPLNIPAPVFFKEHTHFWLYWMLAWNEPCWTRYVRRTPQTHQPISPIFPGFIMMKSYTHHTTLSNSFWMGFAASINFSKSLSRFARSSLRFLFSAISPCFFLSRPCLCCSSASLSSRSFSIRATVKAFSSRPACSGCSDKNCSTDTRGKDWYLWLCDILANLSLQGVEFSKG